MDLVNRRVGILGAGREALAAARFLRDRFPLIRLTLICESEPAAETRSSLNGRDELRVCAFSDASLERFDLLIRSPGVSPYRPEISKARESGTGFTTPSNLWFAAHPDARTLCITGTKGKSTTSAMIAHVLNSGGLKVRLAGNIGLPLLDCDDSGVDWWVIELSSYQLADLQASPSIGVLLNLSAEHLDWHGSEDVYRRDKLRLVELCRHGTLVLNASDPLLAERYSHLENVQWFNSSDVIHASGSGLKSGRRTLPVALADSLPGQHNLANAAAALTAARLAGCDLENAARSLGSFQGLPHRLQCVGERAGIRFYNDSISSTPMATEAALKAFAGEKISLIVGGLDRGLDWAPYMKTFRLAKLVSVVAVPDSGVRILEDLKRAGIRPTGGLHLASNLEKAVEVAGELTPPGGVVLLSPGAPSFPRFRDYRDRGRQFAQYCGFELEERGLF